MGVKAITKCSNTVHVENGKRIRVIIVQAEEAQGQKLIGAKTVGGGELVGLLTEFELLGIKAQ